MSSEQRSSYHLLLISEEGGESADKDLFGLFFWNFAFLSSDKPQQVYLSSFVLAHESVRSLLLYQET